MTKLKLRKLTLEDEKAFFQGLADWPEEDRDWFTFDWEPGIPFAEHLERLEKNEKGIDLKVGFVSSSMLYGFVGNRIVGRVSIRHELNEQLKKKGGHMGYAVAELFRKKGYGFEMAKQALPYCAALGIKELLITCSDDNVPSCRIIEKLGGVLLNKVAEEDRRVTRRYAIQLAQDAT